MTEARRRAMVGKMEMIYLSLHYHHQNDFCITAVGSDESYFNVSVGNDEQSHKTVSTNHNLSLPNHNLSEEKRNRAEALLITS